MTSPGIERGRQEGRAVTGPNIVLVTIDSLRTDHCSFAGYERETTPTLDMMAREGVAFENAVAPGPSTPESMPAVFTGEQPPDVRRGVASRERIHSHLSRRRTLTERLRTAGYSTIGFTPNPFTSRYFGFDQGFDRFRDFLGADGGIRTAIVSRWLEGRFVAGLRFGVNMIGRGDISLTWEDYYEEVVDSTLAADDPFFLWVFLLEPHWPYRPPARNRDGVSSIRMYRSNWVTSNFSDATPTESGSETARSLYDGAVRHADEFLERLVRDLEDADPVVVVHGDHGEAFGEHGSFGHGRYLYEENVHVPLVVWNAGSRPRVRGPVSLESLPWLLRALSTPRERVDWTEFTRPLVRTTTGTSAAVRGRDSKLIREDGTVRFYDLRSDPGEQDPRTGNDLEEVWDRAEATATTAGSECERLADITTELEVEKL
jgi:arylsulfatase